MPDERALRRCLLGALLLHEVDARVTRAGAVLAGVPPVTLRWSLLRRALDPLPPEAPGAARRLGVWLARRRRVAELSAVGMLDDLLCVLGLPVGSPRHPGPGWPRATVLGGAIDLGAGLPGLDPAQPEVTLAVDATLLDGLTPGPGGWWERAEAELERLGTLAADRYRTDPDRALRPFGTADVVTLLATAPLRHALAAAQPDGLATVAVPVRHRGWTQLRRIDPAFVAAAAALADPEERAFARPLLVTTDEVVLPRPGGHPRSSALEVSPAG